MRLSLDAASYHAVPVSGSLGRLRRWHICVKRVLGLSADSVGLRQHSIHAHTFDRKSTVAVTTLWWLDSLNFFVQFRSLNLWQVTGEQWQPEVVFESLIKEDQC